EPVPGRLRGEDPLRARTRLHLADRSSMPVAGAGSPSKGAAVPAAGRRRERDHHHATGHLAEPDLPVGALDSPEYPIEGNDADRRGGLSGERPTAPRRNRNAL